jgi:hypothetical protein
VLVVYTCNNHPPVCLLTEIRREKIDLKSLQLSGRFKVRDGHTQNIILTLINYEEVLKNHLNEQIMVVTKLVNHTKLVILGEHSNI